MKTSGVYYLEERVRANFLRERLDYLNSVEGGWNPTRLSNEVEKLRRENYPEDRFQSGSMRNTINNALDDAASTNMKTFTLIVRAMEGKTKIEWPIVENRKISSTETIDI